MFNPTEPYDFKRVQERFERDVLPVLKRYGPEMGEKAMQGDTLAEQIIRRYHIWLAWIDPFNLKFLETLIHKWLKQKDAK